MCASMCEVTRRLMVLGVIVGNTVVAFIPVEAELTLWLTAVAARPAPIAAMAAVRSKMVRAC